MTVVENFFHRFLFECYSNLLNLTICRFFGIIDIFWCFLGDKIVKRINRFLSMVLAVIVALSIIPMTGIKAEAASQNEAVVWAKAQVGKSINHDGIYGAQCVDLIQAYYSYLGAKSPSITANKYASVSLPSGWKRIAYYSGFVPQPGDIAVWTYASSSSGHVAIVTSATSSSMNVVEQNGSQGYTRAHRYNYSYGRFYGVIRPNLTGGSSNGQDSCSCSTDYVGAYRTNTGADYTLNIRSGHGTSYSVIGSIPNGTTVNVTKSDDKWAHITYDGVSGYVSMDYLEKLDAITVCCSVNSLNLTLGETASGTVKVWTEGYNEKKTHLTFSVNNNVVKCELGKDGNAVITAQTSGSAKVTFSVVEDETNKILHSKVVDVSVNEKTYTVIYNANGGSGTMSNSTHTYGVEKALNANKFTRKGYTFLGWSTSSTATKATYTDKQSVKNLTTTNGDKVTLYAVWQKNDNSSQNPSTSFTFSVQDPSIVKIRNKDGIVLYTKVEGKLPDGARVEWSWDNDNFDVKLNDDGTITIIAENNGDTSFTATVYDAKGNVLVFDTVEMTSKSGFIDKIGGFFRSLFGATTIYKN